MKFGCEVMTLDADLAATRFNHVPSSFRGVLKTCKCQCGTMKYMLKDLERCTTSNETTLVKNNTKMNVAAVSMLKF